MPSYVMLTRLEDDSMRSQAGLEKLGKQMTEHIRKECPKVKWSANYAVQGPYDYLGFFAAPDNDAAKNVATVIRKFGHADTEVWPAQEWRSSKEMVRAMLATRR